MTAVHPETAAELAELTGLLVEPELPVEPPRIVPDNPLVLARWDELVSNHDNVRACLPNIPGLEASILAHGLLENLVGIEIPERERTTEHGWIEVKAGSRRMAAIENLRRKGHWPLDRPIPVLMRDSRGFWENLVENVMREDVEPWDIGRRLSEASSSGLTHRDIGTRVGKTQGWVTRHIHIGTGLAPETIAFIKHNRIDRHLGELYRLSFYRDPYGDPDAEAQLAALSRRTRRRPPTARHKDSLRAFSNRINYIRNQMPVPALIRPVVSAVLEYLEGGGRPNFRQLSERLMGDRRRLLGEDEDEIGPGESE